MTLFDDYLAVDWSASRVPKSGSDSIWLCLHGREPENPRTRAAATERVRRLLRDALDAGRRILVGFDFPYGYPAGFADRVAPGPAPAWRRIWDLLSELVEDDEGNGNNRHAVAAELNRRLGEDAFWGRPLSPTKPQPAPVREWRHVEQTLRTRRLYPKSVWQLSYAGCVGGQALVGIPRVRALRLDPGLAAASAVWPFETGFRVPPREARVVHAEIWPTMAPFAAGLHPVRDAAQVASVAGFWARLDAAGSLRPWFEAAGTTSAADEEGWILGA